MSQFPGQGLDWETSQSLNESRAPRRVSDILTSNYEILPVPHLTIPASTGKMSAF